MMNIRIRTAAQFKQMVDKIIYKMFDLREERNDLRELLFKAYYEGYKAGKNENNSIT